MPLSASRKGPPLGPLTGRGLEELLERAPVGCQAARPSQAQELALPQPALGSARQTECLLEPVMFELALELQTGQQWPALVLERLTGPMLESRLRRETLAPVLRTLQWGRLCPRWACPQWCRCWWALGGCLLAALLGSASGCQDWVWPAQLSDQLQVVVWGQRSAAGLKVLLSALLLQKGPVSLLAAAPVHPLASGCLTARRLAPLSQLAWARQLWQRLALRWALPPPLAPDCRWER